MSNKIKMIGIGTNGPASLFPLYLSWIEESEVLIGGQRQLSYFPDYQGEKIAIKGNISSLARKLQKETRNTVILASGDPLFFGIGSYLSNKLPIRILPNISSIQLAFAKMGEPWQDADFVSVHGRSMAGLAQRIDGKKKVAILTDESNSPAKIANYLLEYGMTEYRAFVAENLGDETERSGWHELAEMADAEFHPLNVVILKKVQEGPVWPLGIEDEEFHQRKPDKGLITKKDVRSLSIIALQLKKNSVVWDIGTCTGSVAIEAARIASEGQVFAVEKNEKDLENCYQNMRKFRADITVKHAKAPQGLEDFPDPDAIFIGGTAGNMEDILDQCCSRLKKNGNIVLNAVTIESLGQSVEGFKKRGFDTSITLAQISKSKPILNLTRFDALNPIYIIRARKKLAE
ncbi:precorrin-6y C5,15-methyltransferase (decarboxylating) subunit CbiE [Peribacillus saganii]|uniref:Precorrin-6y C5,15-methyltransferase (Decarboxylating) subunit CbiE n=1 Tax=Peribacillus saganii TaxID=2303992 RepID=A0A372LE18_9BACI|nr:precorrin-6y C5,15-methyltransferase (decarboxylating) subunit CbiE [Peribacillus saganii]RFU64520.1 precorrin-6y C5,15-methyltransferase (decarboxylating) subunit CbiE [Peribacillus saganii]